MKNNKLAIIIPAHNEEKRIENTLKEYLKFFREINKKNKLEFKIIVAANGCKDNTVSIVKKIKKKTKAKEIVILDFKEVGKGFAIKKGFEYALKNNFDLIGFVDADASTSPMSFYDLVKNINEFDGIIASRWIKGSIVKYSLIRKIQSRVFNFIVRFLFFLPYQDTQCGAKLFKKRLVEKVLPLLTLTDWAFDVNLLYLSKKFNFKIKEIPTIWIEKKGGKTNFRTPIMMFLAILRIRVIYSFLEKPLKPLRKIVHLTYNILKK